MMVSKYRSDRGHRWLVMAALSVIVVASGCGGGPGDTATSSTQTGTAGMPTSTGALAITPTPMSMDYYGLMPTARAGDQVSVEDAQGVVCGLFTVHTAGQYGFVHVYADDPMTPGVDEGASVGDILTFKLNGAVISTANGSAVKWLGDGQRQKVDFL